MEHCKDHSGCLADIETLKKDTGELWAAVTDIRNAINYRLPLWATFLIAFLSSVSTWGITHK